jgi:hypothetical protein
MLGFHLLHLYIVSDFCADTSPDVFEETGCAVCGKLTPICTMEELSEIENVSLLKADGVTRKARLKGSDPVKELRGPILAPACNTCGSGPLLCMAGYSSL